MKLPVGNPKKDFAYPLVALTAFFSAVYILLHIFSAVPTFQKDIVLSNSQLEQIAEELHREELRLDKIEGEQE